MPPLYSTITLIAEVIISSIIFYIFYQGYRHNKFPRKLVAITLAYEILFNISYMATRVPAHTEKLEIPWKIGLAAFHGILSLIMFLSLIVFFSMAWKNYKKGVNYFKKHKYITFVFLGLWSLSVLSGIVFYFVEYYY